MMESAAATPGQAISGGGGSAGRPPLLLNVLGSGTTSADHLEAVPRRPPSNRYNDRFIPDRSTVDFDLAHYLLTETRRREDNTAVISPQQEAYRKRLADCFFQGRDRIFRLKPKQSDVRSIFKEDCTDCNPSSRKLRYIPQSSERVFEVSDLLDDYYLNLLDWGSGNVLAVALGDTVALVDPSDGSVPDLITVHEQKGPITSVNWAVDGQRLAIGLNNSDVEVWDANSMKLLRTLRGCHRSRVGSLAWNNDVLATGGLDAKIVLNDVRMSSHILRTYKGHRQEVCGLKWAGFGQRLASGGDDNFLCIWDSSYNPTWSQWLYRFEDHRDAVKALAWCPFQSNLLASGGGSNDRCIKFWNISSGACLSSVDTGSQVCALLWNKNEKELLSSHGSRKNQLILWRYPSMVRMAELKGHASRVLFMAQSPNGCTVASAAGNDTLRLWNVFGDPKAQKPAKRTNAGPFSSFHCMVRNIFF